MDFTVVVINLIVLLILAKILGELCERIGLPSILGYILTGIICGNMVFGYFTTNFLHPALGPSPALDLLNFQSDNIIIFAQLGVILMLFITGFQEGNVEEIIKNRKAIALTSLMGYFTPFLAAVTIGYAFSGYLGFDFSTFALLNFVLLLGLAVSSTDSSIALKSVMSAGKLNSKPGKLILGVTMMDSIMGLIIFNIVMTYVSLGSVNVIEILRVIAMICVFLLFFIVMERLVPMLVRLVEHMSVEQAEFSFAFIFMILLAVIAEHLGLSGIIGAFLAGIIIGRCPIATTSFVKKLSSISYGIFIPLFFVWTGLLLDFGNLTGTPQLAFALTLIVGVLAANALAAHLAGKLNRFNAQDCRLMSIAMLPRGDINLVIASVAITMTRGDLNVVPLEIGGFIYSTVMLLILVGMVITFVLLKLFVKTKKG
jgi:Kef-type K+ transport system membrane component KefB